MHACLKLIIQYIARTQQKLRSDEKKKYQRPFDHHRILPIRIDLYLICAM
jgi:hypothetical protein